MGQGSGFISPSPPKVGWAPGNRIAEGRILIWGS
jgi:hypothetical protein